MPAERWLITGAAGQLGAHLVRQLADRDSGDPPPVLACYSPRTATDAGSVAIAGGLADIPPPTRQIAHLDFADFDALWRAVRSFRPTFLIHAAAMSAVGDCFARPLDADRINTQATAILAAAADACGAHLVYTSTDMVFDGTSAPYRESDPPRPLSRYGWTKAAAETVLAAHPRALVVRIPLMYGLPARPRTTTFLSQLAALHAGQPLRLFTDEFRTPLWLADAARALIGLARSGHTGLLHVTGPERLSRFDLIARCAALLGLSPANLVPISRLSIPSAEPRPADLSLDGSLFLREFPTLAPGPLRLAALV